MTEIFVFRHSDRLDKSKDDEEKNKWLNSKRFKENPWDSPLSQLGIKNTERMADKLIKHANINKIKYFYSSPISRCMETAIHMINMIYDKTGHQIYIRVEYGLTEPLILYTTVYFEKNKIKSISIPEEKNGIKFITKIDKKLYPSELKKKYKKYLDPKFNIAKQSVINYKNVIGGTENENIERAIKAVKKIIKQNTVIITHGTIAYWIYQYITQNKPSLTAFPKYFGGRKNTGVMTGFKINKIPGKVIYKPNNK